MPDMQAVAKESKWNVLLWILLTKSCSFLLRGYMVTLVTVTILSVTQRRNILFSRHLSHFWAKILYLKGFRKILPSPHPSHIPHMILHIVTCINRNQICRFHFMMPECYGRDGVREMWGRCEGFSGPLTCRISLVQRLFRRKCEGWDRKELLHIKSSKWACFAIWSWQNQGYVYNDAY